jgi:hypothetical protein
LAGTVLGGLVTHLGQTSAHRAQNQREQAERHQRRHDMRREACAAYLAKVDEVHEAGRALCATLDASSTDERNVYLQAWQTFSTGLGEPQLAGPREISDAAVKLAQRSRRLQLRGGPKRGVESAETAMIAARGAFASEVREALAL